MTSGPTFGSPSINVVIQNTAQLHDEEEASTIPTWVIVGASVAFIMKEVDVSPAILIERNRVRISITPTKDTKPGVEYQVIALIGDDVVGPEIIQWTKNDIKKRRVRIVEFAHKIKPPTKIIVNVIRGEL